MSNYLPELKTKSKKLRIDNFFSGVDKRFDQSVLPASTSISTYGFDFSSGALTDGIGVSHISVNYSLVVCVWRFVKNNEEIIMFSCSGGQVYYINGEEAYSLNDILLKGKVQTCNYRMHGKDVILMWNDQYIAVWDGDNIAYNFENSPLIRSMDICEGLMFVADADGETLRYTQEMDPTNWNQTLSEGGKMTMTDGAGKIGKLVSFLGYLFVFRDYSITRVSVSGGKPLPAAVFASCGKIFVDTVTLAGDKIIFLADDGIYQFDGLSTKQILPNLCGLQGSNDSRAAFYNGRYWLSTKAVFDGELDSALVSYKLSDKTYTVSKGLNITSFGPALSGLYVVCNARIGKITHNAVCLGENMHKCWTSPLIDLGSERTKILKEVCLETKGDITLTVKSERAEKSVLIKGSTLPSRVRFNIRGKKLGFKIESSTPDSYISRPVLMYTEI